MEIVGKKILITGAAKRIGRALALHLASLGAKVILHYHQSEKEAKALQKTIYQKYGQKPALLQADLSRSDEVLHLAAQTWSECGPIDVLINNASAFYPTSLGSIYPKDWEILSAVNAMAPMILMDRIGIRMKKRGKGKIINIADSNTMKSPQAFIPYNASKAALISISQGYARALAPQVQVNTILPGPILWPPHYKAASKKKVLKKTLLKKIGKPDDIAKLIEFLIRDGDYMVGSLLNVDGGVSIY
jgi:NAD(P)-dependent dehydrogenase (short-subunit alcohol dehydrogenase family)